MKFGVVVFPGSNCDDDAYYAIGSVLRQPVEFLWHRTENLGWLRRDYSSRRLRLRRLSCARAPSRAFRR